MNGSPAILTGWGRTAASAAKVVAIDDDTVADAVAMAQKASGRGALARGLGRSYGDAAQNGGGVVMRLAGVADDVVIDDVAQTMRVGAGVGVDDLLRVIVPRGYFVPVTAGTRFITIGGAIASDIHGKNHHREGSFGNHVRELSLLLADGSVAVVSPTARPELFWTTIGGMGLTGIVLDATINLIPIETSRCIVDTIRADDLDEVMAAMEDGDDRYRYAVAWIDLMAKGRHLGRSILAHGEHATLEQLGPKERKAPLLYRAGIIADVPPVFPILSLIHI